MSGPELLEIEPLEIRFPFELKKQISCSLQLLNKTDDYVAFKVKTTNPKKYCVRPNTGVVVPRSACESEPTTDMQCKDKFLVESVIASAGLTAKDVSPEMFSKEYGNTVEECKLKVVYVSPPQPPSPVAEVSEESSSPRPYLSDNNVSRALAESQEKPSEAMSLILKLTAEKNSALQLNNKLPQELEVLRQETSRQGGGFSFMAVVLITMLGILLGYLVKT